MGAGAMSDVQHNPAWVEDVVAAFRALRARGGRLKGHAADGHAVKAALQPLHTRGATWRARVASRDQARPPAAQLLAAQDFLSANSLVCATVDAFILAYSDSKCSNAGCEEQHASDGEQDNEDREEPESLIADGACVDDVAWRSRCAEWVFASLVFAQEPIVDEVQYQLQKLRRTCSQALTDGVSRGDSTSSRAPVALLHVIVTEVFGQR